MIHHGGKKQSGSVLLSFSYPTMMNHGAVSTGCPYQTMIENLPEPYAQALILTEYEELTQKELAQRLGISVSGAKSRVQLLFVSTPLQKMFMILQLRGIYNFSLRVGLLTATQTQQEPIGSHQKIVYAANYS